MTTGDGPELTAVPQNEGIDAAVHAARQVIEALLGAGGRSSAEMVQVADRLHEVADYLRGHAPSREDRLVDMWSGEGVTRHDPVTGPENAIAPPVHLRGMPDGSVEGRFTLSLPYQGPPGCVHGGVSALVLDHTLGVANHWAGVSGMTGTLTLRYHRPTPLWRELVVTARQDDVEGRKIFTSGEITVDGELCVSAQGIFVNTHLPRPR